MANALIIFRQTVIMFLYMAVGFGLFRARLITKEGSASMAHLLLYVVLPAVVIRSFQVEYSPEKARELLISIAVGALLLLAAMLIAHVLLRKNPIDDFGAAFSNAGFMGFPLITALLGGDAVFYAAGFVAMLNALQWTYGQYLLSGDRADLSLKKIFSSPLVLSLLLGLALFFLRIQLPPLIGSAVSSLSAMNAPLAMVILGCIWRRWM